MKRLYLLLLGVFVLFISLTSVSYAYTLDDVFTYASQLVGTPSNTPYTDRNNLIYTNGYNYLLRFEEQIRYRFNQSFSNANYFVVHFSNTSYQYNATGIQASIFFYSTSPTIGHTSTTLTDGTFSRIWFSNGAKLGRIDLSSYGEFSYSVGSWSGGADIYPNAYTSSQPKGFCLIEDNQDYHINPGYQHYLINGLELPAQYTFIPAVNENVNVILSNNLSGECIRLPFSPSENYKLIGHIEGWEDLDGFTLNWSPILYVSGDDTVGDVASRYIYSKQNGGLSDGHITFMNINDGAVYINVDTLYNRQVYVLSIDAHIGDDYFPIYLDGHDYDATFYSYFYTTDTSVPSNNTGISQQYYESLPPSLQNFLEDNSTNFNDTQQNNINYLLNDMFSDVFSGDQFGGNLALEMGYSGDILDSNYYSNLIYDFYRKIINTIATEDTSSSITFNIRSKTFVLNSSDFLVPSGPLKTFVTTFLIAGIVYLFYLQIHRIVLSIATLDLYTTIKSFDQKHSVFM